MPSYSVTISFLPLLSLFFSWILSFGIICAGYRCFHFEVLKYIPVWIKSLRQKKLLIASIGRLQHAVITGLFQLGRLGVFMAMPARPGNAQKLMCWHGLFYSVWDGCLLGYSLGWDNLLFHSQGLLVVGLASMPFLL